MVFHLHSTETDALEFVLIPGNAGHDRARPRPAAPFLSLAPSIRATPTIAPGLFIAPGGDEKDVYCVHDERGAKKAPHCCALSTTCTVAIALTRAGVRDQQKKSENTVRMRGARDTRKVLVCAPKIGFQTETESQREKNRKEQGAVRGVRWVEGYNTGLSFLEIAGGCTGEACCGNESFEVKAWGLGAKMKMRVCRTSVRGRSQAQSTHLKPVQPPDIPLSARSPA